MTTITVEQFKGYNQDWGKLRNNQFKYNWTVHGGWEGWIQVDLVAYILSEDSTIEILREQPIYTNPRKRVDLLLNTTLSVDFFRDRIFMIFPVTQRMLFYLYQYPESYPSTPQNLLHH